MKTKKICCFLLFALISVGLDAQKWVDTVYSLQETKDIVYGQALDFGGTMRSLQMDICVPKGDSVPPCGRPLLMIVHGGAFLAGDKAQDAPPRLMRDFAKRGYVTASINYRLGFFQTSSQINCNISGAGAPWNCLNASDSAEWERALYRGMQDAKGAIRYMVNRSSTYKIDARNVFLIGESAGGFVVLSTAFTDDSTEKPLSCGALATVARPNKIYENQCVVSPGFAVSIDSLKLLRPDLGPVQGQLNLPSAPYLIKGVASFFGGMYTDLFTAYRYQNAPALYMFHQPNDLIVPYNRDKLFAAYAYCATQFPANCQYIVNRKTVMGSRGIRDLAAHLGAKGIKVPTIVFDSTSNTADCFAQIANPALAGHAIDNFSLRSGKIAVLFAKSIDTSSNCKITEIKQNVFVQPNLKLFPNPVVKNLYFESDQNVSSIEITEMSSRLISRIHTDAFNGHIELSGLPSGMYLVKVYGLNYTECKRIWIE